MTDAELRKKLLRLAYLHEARWWLIPILIAWVLSQAIARDYKVDSLWHLDWKIELTFEGKIILTPTDHHQKEQVPNQQADIPD